MPRPTCDLVIFDCDGVLVDSEPIVNGVYVDVLREHGVAVDAAAALRAFSGGTAAKRYAAAALLLGGSLPDGFVDHFERRLAAAFARDLRAVDGVQAALASLPTARCVASNGGHRDMRARLATTGLLDAFAPHLFSADDVPRPKPAPDLFLHAARSMRVAPARCAVVEDSVPGVRAAVDAGMAVYGFARVTSAAALARAGARTFTEMARLPTLVRGA